MLKCNKPNLQDVLLLGQPILLYLNANGILIYCKTSSQNI